MSVKVNQRRKNHYHGHVCLEFKSAITGIRERIEHDNDFTDAIDNYLNNGGFFDISPFSSSSWKNELLHKKLTGGVFLFDRAIDKVNDKYPTMMPAGTKMTANGSYGVSNSTLVTELGSFNENESSFTRNSLTYVYDWSTQQGNGDIGAVCLTSDVGGYIGYGNSTSQVAHTTKKRITEGQTIGTTQNKDVFTTNRSYKTTNNDTFYSIVSIDEDGLFLSERPFSMAEVSLFGQSGSETRWNNPLPSVMEGTRFFAIPASPGKYCVIQRPQSGDSNITVGIYDCETNTWDTHTVAVTMSADYESYYYACDDFIAFARETASGEYGQIITLPDHRKLTGLIHPTNISSTISLSKNIAMDYRGNIIDIVNRTSYPSNGNIPVDSNGVRYSHLGDMLIGNSIPSDTYFLRAFHNPLYLATVANLDNVVTKTSSQTMKLIYTVTRV